MRARASERRRALLVALICLTCLGWPDSVHAAAPVATEAEQERARQLYESAIQHYNVAEYDEAIALSKQAYVITAAPELLFNIAQAYRLKGPDSCGDALQVYRSFLRQDPKTPRRASVESMIEKMRRCVEEHATSVSGKTADGTKPEPLAAVESPAPTEGSPKPNRAIHPTAVALGAVGIAAIASGVGLLAYTRIEYDSLKDAGCAPNCASDRVDGPRTAQVAGYALVGIGAAVGTAGLVIWLVGRRGSHRASAATRSGL